MRGRNVLLVVLESTGSRHLKTYGAAQDPMPNLTALARRALVVDRAYAVYPESVKGLFATLCSRYPAFDTSPEIYAGVPCAPLPAILSGGGRIVVPALDPDNITSAFQDLIRGGPARRVTVPDVVGMNYGDAVQALNDANLNAKKHEVFSQRPAGQVIAQDPPAGNDVVVGTEVVLDVSKGTKQVEVPNVVGMTEADAQSTLQAAGFEVSSTSAPSDTTPQGNVSDQSPDGGTQAAKGSTVAITVSSGPSTTTVPDEIGQDKQVAIDDLKANGFKVHAQNVTCGDPNQDNIVQDQDPAGGSDAPTGSTVNIFVCKF